MIIKVGFFIILTSLHKVRDFIKFKNGDIVQQIGLYILCSKAFIFFLVAFSIIVHCTGEVVKLHFILNSISNLEIRKKHYHIWKIFLRIGTKGSWHFSRFLWLSKTLNSYSQKLCFH